MRGGLFCSVIVMGFICWWLRRFIVAVLNSIGLCTTRLFKNFPLQKRNAKGDVLDIPDQPNVFIFITSYVAESV